MHVLKGDAGLALNCVRMRAVFDAVRVRSLLCACIGLAHAACAPLAAAETLSVYIVIIRHLAEKVFPRFWAHGFKFGHPLAFATRHVGVVSPLRGKPWIMRPLYLVLRYSPIFLRSVCAYVC